MSVMYATVTSKGQVTLPVELRRALGIEAGQAIGFTLDGDHAILRGPSPIENVRDMLETATRDRGTWGAEHEGSAWQRDAVRRRADS